MIPFEIHSFCLNEKCKGAFEIVKNSIVLHYKVTSDHQQRFYYIAITEQINQSYTPRPDLGQFLQCDWKDILRTIPRLPDLYNQSKPITKAELNKVSMQMLADYQELQNTIQLLMKSFYEKWIK